MKLITILFCLSILISAGMAAETKVPLDRLNWSQSLPLNANITLDGGDVIGQTFATQYDTIVRQDGINIYALYGKNKTVIDSGPFSPDYNSHVTRSAINATPANGSLYIDRGTYSLACDLNCTAGTSSYIYFWTALPVSSDINIKGAKMGATVLQMAPAQYSTTRPALIMYDYCPFSESGGDGVGPGHQMFSLEDLTFDGDIDNQTAPYYHDGAGLFLSGSMRYNTRIRNVEFKRSPNHALYLGYNGGGWENHAIIENIYTHDNWGSSQLDNTEDTILSNFLSNNDGYGFWTASRMALVLDGMHATSGHLIADNVNIVDGCLSIFGFEKDRDDLSMLLSDVFIDARDIGKHGVYIHHCNNVTLDGGRIWAGDAQYAVSVLNATGVTISDMEMRGLRGIVTETGYRSDIKLSGCDINTSGNCFMIYGTGSTALFTGCDFNTSNPSQYLINVQSNAAASLVGCHGSGNGLVYVGGINGVLTHSGTTGLGLEAYGATSVADGGTIAHGMKITPTYATATGSLAGTTVTVTAKDATHLTIDLAGVTTTQTVNWEAKY